MFTYIRWLIILILYLGWSWMATLEKNCQNTKDNNITMFRQQHSSAKHDCKVMKFRKLILIKYLKHVSTLVYKFHVKANLHSGKLNPRMGFRY